ncbi:MAG: TonB family protein [Alphaproteobacteria bacterium]|nr:TonB family protein [Alphaproteobacteria bacterium]
MRQKFLTLGKLTIIVCTLVAGLPQGDANALDNDVRKIPAMSRSVHKQMQKAQEALSEKEYAKSHAILETLLAQKKINDFERAVAWQLKAMLAFAEDDSADTIEAYEKILTFSNSIPKALEISILYGLSQLYYAEKSYDKALHYAKSWESRADASLTGYKHLKYFANLHYVREEYDLALKYLDKTINLFAQHSTQYVPASWYQMMVSSHWELGNKVKVDQIVQDRLIADPHPRWCRLKAGILIEMGQPKADAIEIARNAAPICADISDTISPVDAGNDTIDKPASGETDSRGETAYLPVKREQPVYPRKAVEEKIEGYVLVELTVLPDGRVDKESIIVLEANPSGYFEKTAVETAATFIYRPKKIDGIPQKVSGVKYRFSFSIAD